MAAFEDSTGPELDLFAGHSWTDWQNAVESDTAGNESSPESVSTRHGKEVAKLKRQDLGLFGYCPAKDNFYVVVCSHCGFPVKPQAFNYHIEKHHKDKGKVKGFNEPYKTTTKPRFEPSNDANITTDTFPVHRVSPARHKQSEVFRDADPKPSSVSKVKHELASVKSSPKHGTNFGNTGTPLPQQTDEKHKNQDRGHRHQQMKIQRVKPDLVRKLSDVDKRGHTNKHHIKVAKRNHIDQSAKVFVGTSENRLNEVTSVIIKHR
uniref:SCA7 domain-containing protein n=1 Tax=Ciona savignyi TaxID=51511 RepID=H2ZKN1_CIOSA